jgi:hypothetical protein
MAPGLLDVSGMEGMTMTNHVTLLELVTTIMEHTVSEAELLATVVHLVNSGAVRLGGNFRGATFALDDAPVPA